MKQDVRVSRVLAIFFFLSLACFLSGCIHISEPSNCNEFSQYIYGADSQGANSWAGVTVSPDPQLLLIDLSREMETLKSERKHFSNHIYLQTLQLTMTPVPAYSFIDAGPSGSLDAGVPNFNFLNSLEIQVQPPDDPPQNLPLLTILNYSSGGGSTPSPFMINTSNAAIPQVDIYPYLDGSDKNFITVGVTVSFVLQHNDMWIQGNACFYLDGTAGL